MRESNNPPNPAVTAQPPRDTHESLPLWPIVMLAVAAASAIAWVALMIWALRHMFFA